MCTPGTPRKRPVQRRADRRIPFNASQRRRCYPQARQYLFVIITIMNKKIFLGFTTILVVVIVLAIPGVVGYYKDRKPEPHRASMAQNSTTTQSSNTPATTSSTPQLAGQASQISTKVYSDPGGYFSIVIPSSWTVSVGRAGSLEVGGYSYKSEGVALRSADKTEFITVEVYEGKPVCSSLPAQNSFNATLAGLPAQYIPTAGAWTLYTANAIFGIDYFYPGANITQSGGPPDPNSVPPISPALTSNSQELVNTVIDSFHPTNAQKLNC